MLNVFFKDFLILLKKDLVIAKKAAIPPKINCKIKLQVPGSRYA